MQPLKILVLTSLFPPHYIGGYEVGCGDVVAGLRAKSHDVTVLTSTYGVDREVREGFIERSLTIDIHPVAQTTLAHQRRLYERELHNQPRILALAEELKPDIVFVWSFYQASMSAVRMLQARGYRTVFFISDHWPIRIGIFDPWHYMPRHPLRWLGRKRLGRKLGRKTGFRNNLPLSYANAIFASDFLLKQTQPIGPMPNAQVIRWGVDYDLFVRRERPASMGQRLLFVGQISGHKGMETLLEAFALVQQKHGFKQATLSIVGAGLSAEYTSEMQRYAETLGISQSVDWRGKLPRQQLPEIYASHDILIFPSRWDEPFSITVVEALAMGLVVVASDTGGTTEIIKHEETGMVFARDDAASCAAHIATLFDQPTLAQKLHNQATQIVDREFRMSTMIDRVEAALYAACNKDSRHD